MFQYVMLLIAYFLFQNETLAQQVNNIPNYYSHNTILHFTFDQGLTDHSEYQHLGALLGSARILAGVAPRRSYLEIGPGDYVNVPFSFRRQLDPQYITISAWIKPTQAINGSNQYIVSKDRDCQCGQSFIPGGYGLRLNPQGKLQGEVWRQNETSIFRVTSSSTLTSNVWTHVAMTYDGRSIGLFINGRLDYQSPPLATSKAIMPSTYPLTIGTMAMNAPQYYPLLGNIDDVHIVRSGLTPTLISDFYTNTIRVPHSAMHETFDEDEDLTRFGSTQIAVGKNGRGLNLIGRSTPLTTFNDYDLRKGTISLDIKPNWSNATDTQTTRYFMQITKGTSAIRLLRYINPTTRKPYLVAQFEGRDQNGNVYKPEVSTYRSLTNPLDLWNINTWHQVNVYWDFTTTTPYMALEVDKNKKFFISKFIIPPIMGTGTSSIMLGANNVSAWKGDAVFDNVKIFNMSLYDGYNTKDFYISRTFNNGICEEHETIHSSSDCGILNTTVAPRQHGIFYTKGAFEPVYYGTVPVASEIQNRIRVSVARNETESVFINYYSRSARNNLTFTYTRLNNQSNSISYIAASNLDLKIIKNWFQSGYNITRTGLPFYVPELLLQNDQIDLESPQWSSPQNLPNIPLTGYPLTDMQAYTSKSLILNVKVPINAPTGIYETQILAVGDSIYSSVPFTVEVEVLPYELPPSKKVFATYLRSITDDPLSRDYVSTSNYRNQIADIANHELNAVTVYGWNFNDVQNRINIIKSNPKITAVIILASPSSFVNLDTGNLNVYYYGVDEPNDTQKIQTHISLSQTIRQVLGGKVCTAINKIWADYLITNSQQPLDWENISIYGTDKYFEQLTQGLVTKDPQRFQTYYWQSLMEDPQYNRFLTGYYLYISGADGVFPYAYQDARLNPYNDFDLWSSATPGSRDDNTTYPSLQGPISTIQWEAFREGIDDHRYIELAEDLLNRTTGRAPASLLNNSYRSFGFALMQYYQYTIAFDGIVDGTGNPTNINLSFETRRNILKNIIRDLLPYAP